MTTKTSQLYDDAKNLIPGGSQLYSKRPELHAPELWPAYYRSAHGITITDLDGREYKDFSFMGVGTCSLGYTDSDVDTAVLRAIAQGSASTLNCAEEVELAKVLIALHPWADMVRFTRSGGEAMAVAIRIAQTYTKNSNYSYDLGAYHGWHVNNPITGDSYGTYDPNGDDLAAVIVSYCDNYKHYLETMREFATNMGAILILDEITSGFRYGLGGIHLQHDIVPDIAVFGKAIGNGYPIAAVIGKRDIMMAAEDTFISSTSWSERTGYAAAIATIQKMWAEDIFEHTYYIGDLFARRLRELGAQITGRQQLLHINWGSNERNTLYTQLMLEHGYLAGKQFYPSYAHTTHDLHRFLKVAAVVAGRLDTETLRGPVAEKGIRR